jgi:hypothetical protein
MVFKDFEGEVSKRLFPFSFTLETITPLSTNFLKNKSEERLTLET